MTNGNYVVGSSQWTDPATGHTHVGAATPVGIEPHGGASIDLRGSTTVAAVNASISESISGQALDSLKDQLSPLLFGAAWKESGVYARILSLSYYFAFISWPITPTLNILEKQFWQLSWDISRLALTLGTLLLAHQLGCTARSAIALLSVAMMAGYLAHLFLSDLAIRRKTLQHPIAGNSAMIPQQTAINAVEL